MTTDSTVLSTPEVASEVVQPENTTTESTGVSETQTQETEEQRQEREASEAGKRLAAQRKRNQGNAFTRITRRAEQLEQQNSELMRAILESHRAPPGTQPQGPPERNPNESFDEYVIRKSEWAAEQKVVRQLQQIAQEAQRVQAQQIQQQAQRQHAQRVETFAKSDPEFEQLIEQSGDVNIPDAASYLLMQSEQGPQLMKEIARNPQIAAQLHQMSPPQQIYYLGQLAAALNRPPQISKAPPPGKPVGTSTGASPADVRSMSRDQYWKEITKHWNRGKR